MSKSRFIALVMKYYAQNKRHSLPWRQTRDPYKIMVSEIMLQQTQVDRVIPFYTAFIKRFPTINDLAQAPLLEVLKMWGGLGYNRRAKMLHEAAKSIVRVHGGTIPTSRDGLESLSGIGPYTAGAIRAFAFDEPEVFIETNIRTALIHEFFPRGRKVSDKRLMPILTACVGDITSSREWYSALMDYGAHIKSLHTNPSRRSKHHTKQSKFAGSLRQVRGAILTAIVSGKPLGGVQNTYPDTFERAYAALKKEGLL